MRPARVGEIDQSDREDGEWTMYPLVETRSPGRHDRPLSVGAGLAKTGEHLNGVRIDIGLLSAAIGILANASETGHFAQPTPCEKIPRGLLELYGVRALFAATQLKWALNAPIGVSPPEDKERLTVVRSDEDEMNAT